MEANSIGATCGRFEDPNFVRDSFGRDDKTKSRTNIEQKWSIPMTNAIRFARLAETYDGFGFPTDQSIVDCILSARGGVLRDDFVVSPFCIGEWKVFDRLTSVFIDESLIRKLKWPLSDSHAYSMGFMEHFTKVTDSVINSCIAAHIPVCVSPVTFRRLELNVYIGARLLISLTPVYNNVRKSIDEYCSMTGCNAEALEIKLRDDISFCKNVKAIHKVESLDELHTMFDIKVELVKKNAKLLKRLGVIGNGVDVVCRDKEGAILSWVEDYRSTVPRFVQCAGYMAAVYTTPYPDSVMIVSGFRTFDIEFFKDKFGDG
jgi:hypothetical protein